MNRIAIGMTTALLMLTLMVVGNPISNPAHAQETNDNALPAGVIGAEWKLMEIQRSAEDVLNTEHLNVTLKFDAQGHAGGDSTCNYYGADYQTGPDQALTFHNLISTLILCVDTSLMDLEAEYYKALQGVTSYSFDGTTLQLFYNKGDSVLRFGGGSSPGPGPGPGPTIPGMPKTGGDAANHGLFVISGMLLVLLGAGLLASTRRRQAATK